MLSGRWQLFLEFADDFFPDSNLRTQDSPPARLSSSFYFPRDLSGFRGWADEKIKTVREAAADVESRTIPSTGYDNICGKSTVPL